MHSDIRPQLRKHYQNEPLKLRQHVERVVALALELACVHSVDLVDVETAALGHDLFRSRSAEFYRQKAREYGLSRPDYEEFPLMYHGPLAAAYMRETFEYHHWPVLQAVAEHTNLSGQSALNPIAQILFLADKLEPGKEKPYQHELTALARQSLPVAVYQLCGLMADYMAGQGSFAVPHDLLEARQVLAAP